MYRGEALHPHTTLAEHDVVKESTLHVAIAPSRNVNVTVHSHTAAPFTLQVSEAATIAVIKGHVLALTGKLNDPGCPLGQPMAKLADRQSSQEPHLSISIVQISAFSRPYQACCNCALLCEGHGSSAKVDVLYLQFPLQMQFKLCWHLFMFLVKQIRVLRLARFFTRRGASRRAAPRFWRESGHGGLPDTSLIRRSELTNVRCDNMVDNQYDSVRPGGDRREARTFGEAVVQPDNAAGSNLEHRGNSSR